MIIPDWFVHALIAILSLLFGVGIIVTGGSITGKFQRWKKSNPLKLHRNICIIYFLFVSATFLFGIVITYGDYLMIITEPHGIIGLLLVILAFTALVLSPCISKKKRASNIHKYIGYVQVVFLIVQLILGVQNIIS